MDKDKRAHVHEWDPRVLEPTLRKSTMRFRIAVAIAAPALVVGIVGLVMGGKLVLWGLGALCVCVFAASFALRHKTKMDYCAGQLEKIRNGEGPASK